MSTQEIDFDMNFSDDMQQEADKKLFVRFFQEAVHNERASIEAGLPIFDTVDMIEIMYPGRRDTTVGMANHEGYKQRFAKQWAQYSKGIAQTVSGTPLSQVSWLTVGQVAEMKAVNIHSVEQLAGMPDNISQRFMNHHALKQQAQAFLDQAAGNAPLLKLQAELEQRDDKIKQLMSAVEELQRQSAKKVAEKV